MKNRICVFFCGSSALLLLLAVIGCKDSTTPSGFIATNSTTTNINLSNVNLTNINPAGGSAVADVKLDSSTDTLTIGPLWFYKGTDGTIVSGVKEEDYVEALKWSRPAAEQGIPEAQFNLGQFFAYNDPPDYVEAAKWFRKAAEQGLTYAQNMLGMACYNGRGVSQQYAEAVKWYRRSADQGNAWGQLLLGLCYNRGEGVEKDTVEAYKWLNLAATQGSDSFVKARDNVLKTLTPEEIVEGQKRAADFSPQRAKK
jgi:TPR repeat protein